MDKWLVEYLGAVSVKRLGEVRLDMDVLDSSFATCKRYDLTYRMSRK